MAVTSLSGNGRARATMRDVAALAGVSLKTVSRVVNDEPGVSPAVRDRVRSAVRRLDYRPNLAASTLRRTGARTGLVGALVEDISNPYSAGVLRGLEDVARERGTGVLAASLDGGADRERALVHDLVTRRVDALVVMPASERQDYLVGELRTGTPVCFVDRPPRGVECDAVTVDNVLGARLATGHLLDRGHRRVGAVLFQPWISTARDRLAGFVAAHTERGLHAQGRLVVDDLTTAEQATEATHRLLALDDPPTAIFASRNILAAGAARALRDLGLGHEVALVGFDDFPLADLLDPPLTVVRQDMERIGRTAAARVFARVDGDTSPPQHVVLEPVLVPRGSGEISAPS
ncbi:LacI family DNA-binding transcriptional regulator [Phycicoccus endophyticus]|uniref:LacI family DNA-binding transcriptional regulator n=1 Tax=Phycicoccus endophyticus TaxID=1690220 RepID=A0A7G9R1J0_9MICO|nr:LacI family DNA-binding transcriptional regulator [Phycicoccus endophyticus]NHI18747.1 LacI family transcriptional regulator [Phycicoccus endophyticus]QNN49465.1 LacI family DNA-binding transcriptional regulator [Phycicoccus endophyticus]GGL36821.1 LacI family transcriptional regulator [Phycicoccus endophyticus]